MIAIVAEIAKERAELLLALSCALVSPYTIAKEIPKSIAVIVKVNNFRL